MALENQNLSKAAESADARINVAKEDISAMQKETIRKLETDLNQKLGDFKKDQSYEEIKATYKRMNGRTPEDELANIKYQFDSQKSAEDLSAGDNLRAIASMTTKNLGDMLGEITRERANIYRAEQDYDVHIAEVYGATKPAEVQKSLDAVAEVLGSKPGKKLVAYSEQTESMMVELRKPQNFKTMMKVNDNFYLASGGIQINDLTEVVVEKMNRVKEKLKGVTDTTKANALFIDAYNSALKVYQVADDIISKVMFETGGHAEGNDAGHEDVEHHDELYTEEEMQLILNLVLHGSQDKDFLEQLLDPDAAYEKLLRLNPHEMTEAEKYALDALRAGSNIITGTVHLGMHPVDTMSHLLSMGASFLKPGTRAKMAQMAKYGWDNTDMWQKSHLTVQIMSEFLIGAGAGAQMSALLRSKNLASLAGKSSKLARVTGMVSAAEKIAMTLNPILQRLPTLAKYGTYATEIAEGLGQKATGLAHKWDHLLHHLHSGHGQIEKAELVARRTAAPAHEAHEVADAAANPLKDLPISKEVTLTKQDIEIAVANSKELGIQPQQLLELKAALSTLDSLAKV